MARRHIEERTMQVRTATLADVVALVDLQQEGAVRALSHIFPQDTYPFPREVVEHRWRAEIVDRELAAYVGDRSGTLVGFAATRGNELLHFGTKVETWGSGTADEFHDAVVHEIIRAAPDGTTHLQLRVFEANLRARRFYEKLGWRSTEVRTTTPFPPHPTLVEYRLPLDPGSTKP